MSIRKQRNSEVGSQPVNISTLFFQNIVTHHPFGTSQQEREGGPPHYKFPGQLGGLWLGCPKHNTTWKVTYRGESQAECYRRFKATKKKSTLKFNYKFSNFLGQGTCSFFGLIASNPKQTILPSRGRDYGKAAGPRQSAAPKSS